MISLAALHRRLLRLERRRSQDVLAPEEIGQALWHAKETGELPQQPALAAIVQDFLDVRKAIENVQRGLTEEEVEAMSPTHENGPEMASQYESKSLKSFIDIE